VIAVSCRRKEREKRNGSTTSRTHPRGCPRRLCASARCRTAGSSTAGREASLFEIGLGEGGGGESPRLESRQPGSRRVFASARRRCCPPPLHLSSLTHTIALVTVSTHQPIHPHTLVRSNTTVRINAARASVRPLVGFVRRANARRRKASDEGGNPQISAPAPCSFPRPSPHRTTTARGRSSTTHPSSQHRIVSRRFGASQARQEPPSFIRTSARA